MNQEFCAIVGLVSAYLDRHPDGSARLRSFLTDDHDGLWNTEDVSSFTGWKRTHISNLLSAGKIPYISGKPNKFVPSAVKAAVEQMQTGGIYGRRKLKRKTI